MRMSSAGKISGTDGFTLFELIIVLVIISMMSSVVIPRLVDSMGKMNAKTAAKKIAASLRYARARAASEKIPYISVFDFEAGEMAVGKYRENGTDYLYNEDRKIYRFPEGVLLKKAVSGNGEEFESDKFYIMFYPNGGSSGGEIFLSDEREEIFTITVDFITGIVRNGLQQPL